jgi:hypothetical protein
MGGRGTPKPDEVTACAVAVLDVFAVGRGTAQVAAFIANRMS